MMAFAPPKSTDGSKMQTKMSTWTPLNHQLLNDQFDKWTDSQRRRILTGLLERCSLAQQKFCCRKLQERIPAEALDFTTKLPRVLSVYIFSFLDPRSLCRCAQVSWYWKSLAELDQLWMLKCLRFNWYINFSPTPFEQGIWKKHYIQMTPPKDGFIIADVQPVPGSSPEGKQSPSLALRSSASLRKKNNPGEKELPPWRSSDKHPTDIIRFNYLDNCDPEHLWQCRRKRNEVTPHFKRQFRDQKNKLEDGVRLRKARSLTQSPSLRRLILHMRIAQNQILLLPSFAEPGLVLIQQAAPSLLFLTGHKGTLQSVLLPHVDLETTGNNRSMFQFIPPGLFICQWDPQILKQQLRFSRNIFPDTLGFSHPLQRLQSGN
ncbi:F-box only protein 16 [Microtus ochrogaster]|uniref:F-box only protein 16 n=1 Tax=Microtus ochrogaster TaxID=79684 RepID=A0A8J6H0G3_MICOH|nr:F-box only protein 16 [Microtus ochrogaster]